MVAVINFAYSLQNVLSYNENKLKQETEIIDKNGQKKKIKKAEFIHSRNYGKDTHQLRFQDKFKRIERQMLLNENRPKSVTHISLNFDPSETERLKNLDLLKSIADTYMQKIGFGNQPYLVYKHNDSGHPHIHIVSTIIQNSGKPIETQWIGKNVSEPARKEIEQQFGLVIADQRRRKEQFELKPVNASKANYGRSETKRAITNVLDVVLPYYKYSSLEELNAILRHYNVMADQGSDRSRIKKNNGLVYRILDETGNKKGVPIKASEIYSKPGMKHLQKQFTKNEPLKGAYKQRIKNAIDLAMAKRSIGSFEQLQEALKRENIQLVLRQNKQGFIYGLTIVDHLKKVVFNGSDLDKKYSAARMQQRFETPATTQVQTQTLPAQTVHPPQHATGQLPATGQQNKLQSKPKSPLPGAKEKQPAQAVQNTIPFTIENPFDKGVPPDQTTEPTPYELTGKKKKRKKKRLHL